LPELLRVPVGDEVRPLGTPTAVLDAATRAVVDWLIEETVAGLDTDAATSKDEE
jgi:hypothetical protein